MQTYEPQTQVDWFWNVNRRRLNIYAHWVRSQRSNECIVSRRPSSAVTAAIKKTGVIRRRM